MSFSDDTFQKIDKILQSLKQMNVDRILRDELRMDSQKLREEFRKQPYGESQAHNAFIPKRFEDLKRNGGIRFIRIPMKQNYHRSRFKNLKSKSPRRAIDLKVSLDLKALEISQRRCVRVKTIGMKKHYNREKKAKLLAQACKSLGMFCESSHCRVTQKDLQICVGTRQIIATGVKREDHLFGYGFTSYAPTDIDCHVDTLIGDQSIFIEKGKALEHDDPEAEMESLQDETSMVSELKETSKYKSRVELSRVKQQKGRRGFHKVRFKGKTHLRKSLYTRRVVLQRKLLVKWCYHKARKKEVVGLYIAVNAVRQLGPKESDGRIPMKPPESIWNPVDASLKEMKVTWCSVAHLLSGLIHQSGECDPGAVCFENDRRKWLGTVSREYNKLSSPAISPTVKAHELIRNSLVWFERASKSDVGGSEHTCQDNDSCGSVTGLVGEVCDACLLAFDPGGKRCLHAQLFWSDKVKKIFYAEMLQETFTQAGKNRGEHTSINEKDYTVLVQVAFGNNKECCTLIFLEVNPLPSQFTSSYGNKLILVVGSRASHKSSGTFVSSNEMMKKETVAEFKEKIEILIPITMGIDEKMISLLKFIILGSREKEDLFSHDWFQSPRPPELIYHVLELMKLISTTCETGFMALINSEGGSSGDTTIGWKRYMRYSMDTNIYDNDIWYLMSLALLMMQVFYSQVKGGEVIVSDLRQTLHFTQERFHLPRPPERYTKGPAWCLMTRFLFKITGCYCKFNLEDKVVVNRGVLISFGLVNSYWA